LQVFNAAFAAACIGIEHLNESLYGRNGRMKPAMKFLVLLFVALLANAAPAETPHEQLQQMVEQLQKSPGDNALREKIIKVAPTLKPSPALPDAAVTFEGRARFAFKNAKSEDDYLAAAREYEKAVATAPWVLNLYSDLCLSYEKAGKYGDAKRQCGYYLSGLTDPAQIADVKGRIAGLEFGIEKANSPQARAASQKQRDEELVRSLDGGVWLCDDDQRWRYTIEIKGNRLFRVTVNKNDHNLDHSNLKATLTGKKFIVPGSAQCNRNIDYSDSNSCDGTGEISDDGKTILYPVIYAFKDRIGEKTEECRRIR
jgi:hypothetical protein